jgi:hypothetical protein
MYEVMVIIGGAVIAFLAMLWWATGGPVEE